MLHFLDELNPPEPEPEEEADKIAPQVAQPQMIQSFSPATAVPSVPAMMPQGQMPVMVRPFQLNPFGST